MLHNLEIRPGVLGLERWIRDSKLERGMSSCEYFLWIRCSMAVRMWRYWDQGIVIPYLRSKVSLSIILLCCRKMIYTGETRFFYVIKYSVCFSCWKPRLVGVRGNRQDLQKKLTAEIVSKFQWRREVSITFDMRGSFWGRHPNNAGKGDNFSIAFLYVKPIIIQEHVPHI